MSHKLLNAVADLNEDEVLKKVKALKDKKVPALEIIESLQEGMAIVGDLYEKGEYFVGDLLFAGDLLTNAINIIMPVLGGANTQKIGTIVLGTVQGDVHDIGKNIFRSMAEAAGFEVVDLGIDISTSTFVDKVKSMKPQIIGMSGVLTLALESMKNTVNTLKKAGLRDNVKIIIGGNLISENARRMVGADAFTTNAAEGLKICKGWV